MNTPSETSRVARRGLAGALLAAGFATAARGTTPAAAPVATDEAATRQLLRDRRTPNETLLDHNGRPVRFYDDVIKGRTVLINVMYSVCQRICTPATRNLIEARQLLGREARDLHFVSLSLTPLSDPPEALREYKKLHGIGDDWTFLTGRVEAVERVQRAMGFLSDRDTDDLLSHSGMARLVDERSLKWVHVNTMLSGRSIARMIRFERV